MKGITVKYFKSWDEMKNAIKNAKCGMLEDKETQLIHTYKVYFDHTKKAIKVVGFNKNGEGVYYSYPYYPSTTKGEGGGEVKQIYIYRQKNESDVLERGNMYHFILYNKNGQELEHEIWQGNTPVSKEVNEYDADGRKISETHYDRDGSIDEIKKYYAGRKLSEIHYNGDGSIDSIKLYYYNEEGRLSKEEYMQQGLYNMYLGYYNLFYYDKNSRCIKKEEWLDTHKLSEVRKYRYSKKGELLEEKRYSGKSKKCEWRKWYLYDKETNLLVGEKIYKKGRLFVEISYTYDSEGRILHKKDFNHTESRLDSENIYKYNSKGRLIREKDFIRLPGGEEIIKELTEYEYDEKGRLQTQTHKYESELPT